MVYKMLTWSTDMHVPDSDKLLDHTSGIPGPYSINTAQDIRASTNAVTGQALIEAGFDVEWRQGLACRHARWDNLLPLFVQSTLV